jgi:Ca2+-binding RTX toxin-like protein
VIYGSGGNDTLFGNAGDDILYGGPGDDWLYGDAGNDKLYGELGNNVLLGGAGSDLLDTDVAVVAGLEGRNLLIGGAGIDTLRGGLGEEILIGGTTSYDSKAAALAVVMKEWTRTSANPSFDDRCNNLEKGIKDPKLGLIQLVRKAKATPKGTVLDDAAADVLFGGPGSDWFLAFPSDDVRD